MAVIGRSVTRDGKRRLKWRSNKSISFEEGLQGRSVVDCDEHTEKRKGGKASGGEKKDVDVRGFCEYLRIRIYSRRRGKW